MDAIVLVGGQGTRLRPLTLTRHKSLVPVANVPLMEHILGWLEAAGFERAILAIGRFNEDLADAYRAGRPGRLRVELVEERERLESGGAIRHAAQEAGIEGRFAVLNGDVFVDFDFKKMLDEHVRKEAELSMYLWPVPDPSMFGVAVVDEAGRITGFAEKPPPGTAPGNLVNAGVWIFEHGLIDEIPPGPVRVEETLFPSLVARSRPVYGYSAGGAWADLGTPARYLELHSYLAREGSLIAADAAVATDARLEGATIGARARVGGAARLSGSVLWEDVAIGANAVVEGSILADRVCIGEGADVRGSVLGAGASVAPGVRLQDASIEPGVRIDG